MSLAEQVDAAIQAVSWPHIGLLISGGVLTKIVTHTYPKILNLIEKLLFSRRVFSLSGYWVAKFTFPSFRDQWTYEIYRFSQNQDEINFNCYTFPTNTVSTRSSHWRGSGVVQERIFRLTI
jgi:hypothetical protein